MGVKINVKKHIRTRINPNNGQAINETIKTNNPSEIGIDKTEGVGHREEADTKESK